MAYHHPQFASRTRKFTHELRVFFSPSSLTGPSIGSWCAQTSNWLKAIESKRMERRCPPGGGWPQDGERTGSNGLEWDSSRIFMGELPKQNKNIYPTVGMGFKSVGFIYRDIQLLGEPWDDGYQNVSNDRRPFVFDLRKGICQWTSEMSIFFEGKIEEYMQSFWDWQT